jgi:hypothetical protein
MNALYESVKCDLQAARKVYYVVISDPPSADDE